MTEFVAYYRVSTTAQGASGLGLDAQRQAVTRLVNGDGQLVGEFVEVESGKSHKNRPQLDAALAECRKRRATLVIAKLDRLARNVAFIANLMESGVEFKAVDMPTANKLTVHIMAAMAEHEREMISVRTKAALEQAKARGKVLGNPNLAAAREVALAARQPHQHDAEVVRLVTEWRGQGKSFRAIAETLNRLGLRSARGGVWHDTAVRNLLNRPA